MPLHCFLGRGGILPQPQNGQGPSSRGRDRVRVSRRLAGFQTPGHHLGTHTRVGWSPGAGLGRGPSSSVWGASPGRAPSARGCPFPKGWLSASAATGAQPHTQPRWSPTTWGGGGTPLPGQGPAARRDTEAPTRRCRRKQGLSPHRPPEESPGKGPPHLPGQAAWVPRALAVRRSWAPGWLFGPQPPTPLTHLAAAPRCRPEIKNRFSTELGLGFTNSMTVSSWPSWRTRSQSPAKQEPRGAQLSVRVPPR